MNKILMGSTLLLLSGILHAQPPPRPHLPHPMLAATHWQHDSTLIQQRLRLPDGKVKSLETAFLYFYKTLEELLLTERPRPPRAIDVEALVRQRDAAVMRLLSKEEGENFLRMEHMLMPPSPGW